MRTTHTPGSATDRVPGLDTLRAIAVVVVIGYHLDVPFLPGGFLGVTTFFVISGYLITRLLLREIETTGSMNLVRFWTRRLRRLVPAAYVLIVATLGVALVSAPGSLARLRGDALAALGYGLNWRMIVDKLSYFETWELPSPLTHLWSLAVEEQFYLVWPLVLALLLATLRPRQVMVAITVGIIGSSALMALLFDPTDVNRSYLGTDTRAAELLVGALIAVFLHLVRDKQPLLTQQRIDALLTTRPSVVLAVVSASVLAVLFGTLGDASSLAFHGGILLAAVASGGLVVAAQAPVLAGGAAWLDHGPIGAIGRRSYSLYLWHYPVLIAASSAATFADFSMRRAVLVSLVTLVLAEVSYRYVEAPVRRSGFRGSVVLLRRRLAAKPRWAGSVAIAAVAAPVLLASLAMLGVRAPHPADLGPTSLVVGAAPRAQAQDTPATPVTPVPQHHSATPLRRPPLEGSRPTSGTRMRGADIVAVGDSLMIDIAARLRTALPGITINAEVGRQPSTGLDVARRYGQFDRPGGAYILGIGTNGAIDADSLLAFARSHHDARILLITPKVDRPWEQTSINAIHLAAERSPNVRIVDFHQAAQGHPEYFGPDGVHLTAAGIDAMVALIRSAASS